MEASEYRSRFEDSYPFLPEVVDVLYHRWGSYSTFQRTRGATADESPRGLVH